jgi:hypothetical protein
MSEDGWREVTEIWPGAGSQGVSFPEDLYSKESKDGEAGCTTEIPIPQRLLMSSCAVFKMLSMLPCTY